VVTKPFHFEGAHRMRVAEGGLAELQQYVDTLIVIPNQNLFRIANERTTFAEAFKLADNVLHMGVRGVTDLMVMPGLINLDFADIRTVMSEMGKAMMGTGEGSGERRAIEAAEAAISNPLLDEVSMRGARGVLINITGGPDMTLFEVDESANRIKEEVDPDANIIVGSTLDESLEGVMRVSVVATGIEVRSAAGAGVTSEVPASRATSLSMPSFRLRQAPGKPVTGAAPPVKAPALADALTANIERTSAEPHDPARAGAYDRAGPDAPLARPKAEPAGAVIGKAKERSIGEPGFWQPPLPPQERFQEWGKLRAPVREAERPPSLFERVTASFARSRERVGDAPGSAPGGPQGADPRLAPAEEDAYDIPAFLRR
jgi:cell division protein FtsZ